MENLLFTNETGKRLYEQYAKDLPIVDFHCHLSPQELAENKQFECLGEIWLKHDHYKWRAMRTFGIPERLITGEAGFDEKFMAFAEIFPLLAGNPIYVWCALELKRYFSIDEPLSISNADAIYKETKRQIETRNLRPRSFIEMSKVEYIATTDDPVDDLHYHAAIQADTSFKTVVAPTFRPDQVMNISKPDFSDYIERLGKVSGIVITNFDSLIAALEQRLLYFKLHGSTITDHGLDNGFYFAVSMPAEQDTILKKALQGEVLTEQEQKQYRTALLIRLGELYQKHGFVMQLHIGATRNMNSGMLAVLSTDTGFDCTDNESPVCDLGKLLDAMDVSNALPRTILYPLNMGQYETLAILAAAFCTNGRRAHVVLGAPWWFGDQPYGIRRQFESISQLYPLSLSSGMVTDSRSFLAYPRHEVYRRILCDYLGGLVERGEYTSGEEELYKIIEAVCYKNSKEFL